MTPMTGKVFPRTPQGLDKAMTWAAQNQPTITLVGQSTFTLYREAK